VTASRLVRAATASIVASAIAPAGVALGAPHLTFLAPSPGSVSHDSTPKLKGTTDDSFNLLEEFDPVTLEIRDGEGRRVQTPPVTPERENEFWSATAAHLPDGVYTAEATQTNLLHEPGMANVTFAIDATPPQVTITTPSNGSSSTGGSESLGGSAGTAGGDLPAITVQLFAGEATAPQAPVETLVVQASGESWSAAVGGLVPGSYAAQATQSDLAGNTGSSAPVSFTIAAPAAAPPPSASFTWFPRAPRTAEPVSLVSSSTDPLSPIVGFAWAFSSSGPLAPGNPVLITAFANAGAHVVRLRVTDAEGRSSIATQTISVAGPPLTLMQPFPIVRIAGSLTSRGAKVKLLTVQAPVAARVTIRCRGRGCRTASETRTASASSTSKQKPGAVLLSFHRFERSYRAGTVLTILVAKPGQIGKYTSFSIRRHKLPVRTDSCLAANSTPVACAST
jgi:large repetitive protein